MSLALLAAVPACLNLDFALWGSDFGDWDEVPEVPADILACCHEQAELGEDREACIDDALDGHGPCADPADAGAARDARVAPYASDAALP